MELFIRNLENILKILEILKDINTKKKFNNLNFITNVNIKFFLL